MKRVMAVHPRGVWYPVSGPTSVIRHPREVFDVEDADVKALVAGELAVPVKKVVGVKESSDDRGDTIHPGQFVELGESLADKLLKSGAVREFTDDDIDPDREDGQDVGLLAIKSAERRKARAVRTATKARD